MGFFDSASLRRLEAGLNGAALEQRAISQNIANVDTPHYKAKRAHFRQVLETAKDQHVKAHRTSPRHLEFGSQRAGLYLSEDSSTMYNHNGNNVDMDKEMSKLAENQIYYNALTDRLSSKYNSLKSAVRGG
ncbi:flagellar basal body rod protein FlgB [Bacillus piscicola]|uniref:flagellar basal body rod protein FlgB n=1 Tax=Bacillus piscicola TaxID=1632684 RepID=UPI001F09D5F2|nr:flagellar basal body rod protein FlgB [Bacillus piscicola]